MGVTSDEMKTMRHMLKELESPERPLTKWEENFVESVSDQIERRGFATERQFETLTKIYEEKTA